MAEYLIYDTDLTKIADAIRAKDGSTGTMTLAEMPGRIAAIETGGGGSGSQTGVVDTSASYTMISTYFPDAVSVTVPTRVVTATSAAGELQI